MPLMNTPGHVRHCLNQVSRKCYRDSREYMCTLRRCNVFKGLLEAFKQLGVWGDENLRFSLTLYIERVCKVFEPEYFCRYRNQRRIMEQPNRAIVRIRVNDCPETSEFGFENLTGINGE